mmetsp:Transcript_25233/g.51337  ORF Transcript_25233/g.51337 Transcript_25233/m.51337 type:complete len:588 (+) Transcript_25233:244-2007(+)|eukprot:CAMPEP_0181326458 /NCGR_PEP_ID=MMETSP1101-20121128/21507_1 /TAXON_ID=46948 /ORGANISM="Rhodomonas abbreviata, Strain Caron Lab Isolate" /LENGTH=587 /DNA_ID=CAMNT_0023434909 /DNA_START=242 /DNA_END=2005 /DNA_ORIENTATION=+
MSIPGATAQVDAERLKLENVIAGGDSQCQVWAGTLDEPETGLRHAVAVKRFQVDSKFDFANVNREIGISSLASSRCHHCARFWGWCKDAQGQICLVMKRYDQSLGTLLRTMKGGRLMLPAVQRYGKQIAQAVAECHAQNIVISDLKPENILMDKNFDQCVLTDFGISSLVAQGECRSQELEGLHGTFNYMSPESFDTETFGSITTKSDAWSFACCIIEMVTGQVPWAGKSMSAICFKVTSSRETPEIPQELPVNVRQVLARCLAFNSNERPSFTEIFQVFSQDWGLAVDQSRGSDAELQQLKAERQLWFAEREKMAARIRSDSEHIANLQHNVVEHKDINVKLREQLKLLLEGMKQQQQHCTEHERTGAERLGIAPQPSSVQLNACQDALNQCMKQKEVAKDMLRQESARASALCREVKALHERGERMRLLLHAMATETMCATKQVEGIHLEMRKEQAMANSKLQCSPTMSLNPRTTDASEDRVAYSRPSLGARRTPSLEPIQAPHGSHVFDWDTDTPLTSTRESDADTVESAASPLDPRDDWLRRMRLDKKSPFIRLDALSAATTPALSTQNSWESAAYVREFQPI